MHRVPRLLLAAVVLAALAATPLPPESTDAPAALGATTVLTGSAPASMLVQLAEPATFALPSLIDDRSFTADVPANAAAGFVLEPAGGTTGETILGVQFPDGWGFDGGIDQIVNPVEGDVVELAAGTYRLWLLTTPGQAATVTIPLTGPTGTAALTPNEPAGFELDLAEPVAGPVGTTELRHVTTHEPLAGGGWFVSGASFLGGPGSAQTHSLCHLFGGPADDQLTYTSPLCIPRSTVFTGRGGHVSLGPSAFAGIGEDASTAFYMTTTAKPGEAYATNSYHRALAAREVHLGTVWIARDGAGGTG